jgi:hypothetical protein
MAPRCLPILVALALLAGCGSGGSGIAPVSGLVTLNGKPVAKVAVMFQPVAAPGAVNAGPGSYGITDEDGRYTLQLVGKETKGAVVGKHKVRFIAYPDAIDTTNDRPQKRPKSASQIPAKYNDLEGKMEFEVGASGTDSANFQLVSP